MLDCYQMIEKGLDFWFCKFIRMSFILEKNELPTPVYIDRCRTRAVVSTLAGKANLIQ